MSKNTVTQYVYLNDLISPWIDISSTSIATLKVSHLELDTRRLTQGDTFIAIIGHASDGRQFIDQAIAKGANLVLAQSCEHDTHGTVRFIESVPIIYMDDLPRHLSALASQLYRNDNCQLIGVTGTNGKTTITHLIAQWIDKLGDKAAVMGTTGNGFLHALQPAVNTTGNAVDIQATLYQLAQQGAHYAALEVSSHGLVQHRVKALRFSVGVFSNLSRDHLDYHGSMAAYEEAKLSLFTEHHCQHAIINVDDPVGFKWLNLVEGAVAVSLHKQPKTKQALWATHLRYHHRGIELEFDGFCGQGQLSVPLVGEFNASNVMLALATLLALGFDKQALINTAPLLTPVIGRMELFQAEKQAQVVVDYAHTPDALEKALHALRIHCQGQLWVILGCGGDRDKGKRPMMAKVAERHADRVILTDDNPRTEVPAAIIQDMVDGLAQPSAIYIEHNRYAALQYALAQANTNDIILLAGKGHEDYQIIGHETTHYSDRESAQVLLGITQ